MDRLLFASALLGAAALVVGMVLLVSWYRRASARRYALRSLPPLVIPAGGPNLLVPASRSAVAGSAAARSDRLVARRVMSDGAVDTAVRPPGPSVSEPRSANGRGDRRAVPRQGARAAVSQAVGLEAGGAVERAAEAERTVRVTRPMEETLQFLPGRLEIADGEDRGQTIRFVRLFGEPPVITFGRSVGPPHRHVQLRSLTVSRLQARMRYEGRRWLVTNLSETNPTLINGDELSVHATRALEHGDRVEMGEVVFRFWEY